MSNDLFLKRCVSSSSVSGMCKETPEGEKCQTTYFWKDASVPVLSPCFYFCISRFVWFCFVLEGFFLRLSLMQILALVVSALKKIVLRVPFTSECFCGSLFLGLSPLAPLYCSSPLLIFTFLVASFSSGCFIVLFSVGRHRAPFSLLCATFSFFVCFCWVCSTQLFPYWFCSHQFAELGSIHCLAFSARACSLALCLAILFLAIRRAVFVFVLFL